MFYWQLWSSYYKSWADMVLRANETVTQGSVDTDHRISPTEKYEYLTEYGTQVLSVLHPKKGCAYLSKNFESITGNAADACMGNDFYHIVHEDFHERLKELLSFKSSEQKPHSLHCRLRHGDNWQWYVFMIHPQKQKDAAGHICVIENIHENVLAQSTLQKAKLEAELALSARSEFLANMSHELRTPLNAVIGFAQIIEGEMFGQVNSQYLEYARHIQESGYDLLAKIEDLLEIASIDAGRVRLDKEDVYLSDLLKNAVGAQKHHAASSEVLVEYAPPASGDVVLHVDRVKLQHIIGHLLANAIKFSHRGGKVTIEAQADAKRGFVLRVRDHGVGMNKTKLADLTAAMQEENCWSVGKSRTIGMGLALTREFIAMHGGEVHISSATGDGTTVEITLPEECLSTSKAREAEFVQVAG